MRSFNSDPAIRRPLVAYSERLGAVTDIELRFEEEVGAVLQRVPLWTLDDIRSNAAEAEVVLIGSSEPFGHEALAELEACRFLIRRGVGVDNVDLEAASSLGIPVAYVPDASVEEVSDHALAMILSMERRLFSLDAAVRAGRDGDAEEVGRLRNGIRRLSTLTLGLVGLGRIGMALARKTHAIFGEVIGFDPHLEAESRDLRQVGFSEVLESSDIVSIHAPLSAETHHLFGRSALASMRSDAYIVNTSRGGLIDEEALVDSILSGHIAGAGLDVTEIEPVQRDSRLLTTPGVILTGHSAAFSTTSSRELRERSVDAGIRVLQGREPLHLANPEVLASPDCRLGRG